MAEAVVRVIEATKRYGARVALQGVSLALYPGELLALLGPNGAGKSTLVQLVAGLRRPDAGQVWLFGGSPQDAHNRMHLGVTPQQTDLPPTLRVAEVLELVRTHFPRPAPTAELAERFGLEGLLKRQCGGLSGGEKRRVALALAFAGNPRLVLLDEPTTALDVETRRALWGVIRDYQAQGGTVLLTTHYLEEAEALASRVVLLDQGRIVAEGSVGAIKNRVGLKQLRLRASSLPRLTGVARLEQSGDTFTLHTPDADALVRELVRKEVDFSGLEVRPSSLEEAFLSLTKGAPHETGLSPHQS